MYMSSCNKTIINNKKKDEPKSPRELQSSRSAPVLHKTSRDQSQSLLPHHNDAMSISSQLSVESTTYSTTEPSGILVSPKPSVEPMSMQSPPPTANKTVPAGSERKSSVIMATTSTNSSGSVTAEAGKLQLSSQTLRLQSIPIKDSPMCIDPEMIRDDV